MTVFSDLHRESEYLDYTVAIDYQEEGYKIVFTHDGSNGRLWETINKEDEFQSGDWEEVHMWDLPKAVRRQFSMARANWRQMPKLGNELNAFTVVTQILGHMFYEVWTNRNRRVEYRRIKTIKTWDRSVAKAWGELHGLTFAY